MTGRVLVRYQVTELLTDAEQDAAAALLDADERQRHARFRFPEDRRDYAAAHALLRLELSRSTGQPPDCWRFARTDRDKPAIATPAGCSASFSLSHARGIVACAVTDGAPVGVDVERVDRMVDEIAIARRFYSAGESAALEQLTDPADRRARFFELWTLKEAYAKAVGLGLAQPMAQIVFEVDRARQVAFRPTAGIDPREWQFAIDEPAPGTRLAVAVRASRPIAIEISAARQQSA